MTKQLAFSNSILAAIGTAIVTALGGWDMALKILVSMVVLDYVTGLLIAVFEKQVSSEVGWKGLHKKVMIFALVYVAVLVDQATNMNVIRTITIMFYISNEGISILENIGKLGVSYPEPLKNILIQ